MNRITLPFIGHTFLKSTLIFGEGVILIFLATDWLFFFLFSFKETCMVVVVFGSTCLYVWHKIQKFTKGYKVTNESPSYLATNFSFGEQPPLSSFYVFFEIHLLMGVNQ